MSGFTYWGYHIIMDCMSCDVEKIKSRDNIAAFVKELVHRIDMRAYGDPVIEHFATHNPDAAGYSLMQLIETSSITGHFVDVSGDAYLDVFSCKPFMSEPALKVVDEFFSPTQVKVQFITRSARAPILTDAGTTFESFTWHNTLEKGARVA